MNTEYNDNREYKNALDGLRFSEEAKARMAKRLMDTMERPEQAPETRRRVRRLPRIAVIGVAAALALGVGASATGVLKTAGEAFAGVFGPTADTEIIDKIGRPVGASDTDNGVTVTADAIIGDKYHYAVTYSIAKEDGTAFDIDLTDIVGTNLLPMGFADWDTSLMGYFGGAHGGSYFYDADPADNAIQYVETREISDGEVRGHAVRAKFSDLCVYAENDAGELERRVIAEGDWSLKFNLDFEDASVSLPAGQTFELNGMNAVIDEITLSPLALRVDYTVDSAVQWDENAQSGRQSEHDSAQMHKYFESVQILVNRKDGASIDLSNAGGSIGPEGGKTVCQKGDIFTEIIPIEEIASLTVAGMEIPVQ